MNILSRILKDLAKEFRIPDSVDKNLFQRLFLTKKNKQNRITEKTDDGRIKSVSDKGAER
ncbi:hypothetical protein SAMN02746066_04314 [Anaerosporobacter mobilis DSM 15930]|uniref:Uncharacterized protein n=1 Tax=Anaerosporobacter mobilis DSM 15930 TaxID=1120996 RepID=A0A1M7N9F8_9FIRM|nr:hypothetical protein [Anaerosporobacter mobilis]SHN00241.1 hypothetical protein SAMN02746066_04314 [Anaerosporobacter mobilis DSM 15930]